MAPFDLIFQRLRAGAVLGVAGLVLAGCVGTGALDDLDAATPTGSAFTIQLFKNYSYLAHSFGGAGMENDGLFDTGSDFSDLADAFATKALIAAKGIEPDPEPSVDADSAAARERLLRDLAAGKDQFPYDAARAQTDYDCWMLNGTVAAQHAAAQQCRASFDGSIARLEHDLHPPSFAPPPQAAAAPASFTVYFGFDSWTLSAEALGVLQQAIDAARTGQQSHIVLVGHTDTSGAADYNQQLSVRRANVVKEVLVQMGARPDSVEVSGVGESDLAVQTPDGTREPRNRRTVITLTP